MTSQRRPGVVGHLRRSILFVTLSAFGLGSGSVQAGPIVFLTHAITNRCVVNAPMLARSRDKITATGACYGPNGERVSGVNWHAVYTEYDAYDNICGAFAANTSVVPLQLAGSYSLTVRSLS